MRRRNTQSGITLSEMLAVLSAFSLLVLVAAPRLRAWVDVTRTKADAMNKTAIDSIVEHYHRTKSAFPEQTEELPAGDFFGRSLPNSPVSGKPYRLDASSHRVEIERPSDAP